MNKKIAFMTLALMLGASFVGSCGGDEEPQPNENQPADSTQNQSADSTADSPAIVPGYFNGWTSATHVPSPGGNQYFKDFYSPGEATAVRIRKIQEGLLSLNYSSSAWGNANFAALQVQEANGRYIFPDSAQTTINMSRGPMGQPGVSHDYPLTLIQGSVSTDLKDVTLVLRAFMSEQHGSYELTFHPGAAPDPSVE